MPRLCCERNVNAECDWFAPSHVSIQQDWKNNSDQAYSCPRDWRLSASWGKLRAPLKSLNQYSTLSY